MLTLCLRHKYSLGTRHLPFLRDAMMFPSRIINVCQLNLIFLLLQVAQIGALVSNELALTVQSLLQELRIILGDVFYTAHAAKLSDTFHLLVCFYCVTFKFWVIFISATGNIPIFALAPFLSRFKLLLRDLGIP